MTYQWVSGPNSATFFLKIHFHCYISLLNFSYLFYTKRENNADGLPAAGAVVDRQRPFQSLSAQFPHEAVDHCLQCQKDSPLLCASMCDSNYWNILIENVLHNSFSMLSICMVSINILIIIELFKEI